MRSYQETYLKYQREVANVFYNYAQALHLNQKIGTAFSRSGDDQASSGPLRDLLCLLLDTESHSMIERDIHMLSEIDEL